MRKKLIKASIFSLVTFLTINASIKAQGITEVAANAIRVDDSVLLMKSISDFEVNNCDGNYTLLSQAIRHNAKKCCLALIKKGADVNKICGGYVPPIMHAAKYGDLEIVKLLVSHGADVKYIYHGDNPLIEGKSPVTYAEYFKQAEIAQYLRSVLEQRN